MKRNCKLPIVSIGLIPFTIINNEKKYLMIRRKDSVGYIDFLRGKYMLYNKQFIIKLLNVMTKKEKEKLLNIEFKDLWYELWGTDINIQYRNEEKISSEKIKQLKEGININGITFDLKQCIEESTTSFEETEWGFPKGRKNYQEKDLACAIREFEEETGIHKEKINIINNIYPFEEIFIGSNYKAYKHKYFLTYIKENNISLDYFQSTEVSKLEWKTLDECLECIRPYHIEKKNIIKNVDKVLNSLRLIS